MSKNQLTKKWRKQFPILENKIQLSSCSQSAISHQVNQSISEYKESLYKTGMDWDLWMEQVGEARIKFAKLINADVEEVAIVSSVSHAISAVANSIPVHENRNEVLITSSDFPTVGHVWLSQKNRGLNVKLIDHSKSDDPLTSNFIDANLNENCLLASVPHVSFYNGAKLSLTEITEKVHQYGSYILVDAYQSAGQIDIDVKKSQVDILTAGTQKYLLGIPGMAFLYIKKEIADKLTPQITGWFGQKNPFAFDLTNIDYANAAQRFDSGTPSIINCYATNAALSMLLSAGVSDIEHRIQDLSTHTIDEAYERGLTIKSPADASIKGSNTAIYVGNNSVEAEKYLLERDIIVSSRKDVIRIAPHFYNTEEDITQALDLLSEWIQLQE